MGKIKTFFDQNKSYIKETFQMAWPSVLESFFVALAGMIDSLMVSTIGAYAVAAVGLTTQPKFIGLALFIAVNVAVSAIVARRKGQQDQYGANQTLMVALTFVVIMGVVVILICVTFVLIAILVFPTPRCAALITREMILNIIPPMII